jgi:hypothetical protein
MRNTFTALLCVVVSISSLACFQTVHSSREDAMPIAMFPQFADLAVIDSHGRLQEDPANARVLSILRSSGLHPVVNQNGMSVRPDEEVRAREILFTNKRLIDSGVVVILGIPAGSGRRTARGYELPEISPRELLKMPSTTQRIDGPD